jgi:hypothetical protein
VVERGGKRREMEKVEERRGWGWLRFSVPPRGKNKLWISAHAKGKEEEKRGTGQAARKERERQREGRWEKGMSCYSTPRIKPKVGERGDGEGTTLQQ